MSYYTAIRSEIDFRILGNGWGCGFCGTIGSPAPECCDKGREWSLRLAQQLGQTKHETPLPDKHTHARWERVVRRWGSKRTVKDKE